MSQLVGVVLIKVIKTRRVDSNKGDQRPPDVRCRLVAKEVKKRNNTEEESANLLLRIHSTS